MRRPSPGIWIVLVAAAVQIFLFVIISRHRIIDGDEGFYLLASRLVMEHKLPYLDFFYLQMPALPFVYGILMKIFGMSWITGRTISAIFATILGTLLFEAVRSKTKHIVAAVFALILFASNGYVLGWFVTVKTYALSGLLLFAAHQLVTKEPSHKAMTLGGLALGFATDVRLYFVALLPVFLICLYSERRSRRELVCFTFGVLLALLPNLYFVIASPHAFYFDNVGYHAIRTGHYGLVQDFPQKLKILAAWASDFEIGAPLLLGCLLVFLFRAGGSAARLALYLTVAFVGICVLPSPAYAQYFCAALPLLIFGTVTAASDALDRQPSPRVRVFIVCGYSAILVLSFPIWGRAYSQYFYGLAGMKLENWLVPRAVEISHAVDEFAHPGDIVISTWSGYIFESRAAPFPGMENESRLNSAEQLQDKDLWTYRVAAERQIADAIESGTVKVVVFGHLASPPGTTPEEGYYHLLRSSRYRLARRIGDTEIFVLEPRGP